MRRGLLFIGAALVAGACSLPWSDPDPDPAPVEHGTRGVALTPEIVAHEWVGHTSGAVYRFAADGTADAEGVPTATFDGASPFALDAPAGPYTCHGTWKLGPDGHTLTVRFARITDAGGKEPFGGSRTLTFGGLVMDDYPQYAVVLSRYEEWLAPR